MFKIIHFISGKAMGGPKTVFLSHQNLLITLGYNAIAVIRKGADLKDFLTNNTTKYLSYFRIPLPFFRNFAVNKIRNFVNIEQPDLIWLHKPIDTYLWRLAAPSHKIAVVVHGFQKKYLEHADYLIAVSPAVQEHLKSKGFKNIFLLNNFLSFNIEPKKISWNQPLKFSSLGYFRRKKGFTDLLLALSILNKKNSKYEAFLCGHGTLAPVLKIMKYYLKLYNLSIYPWKNNVIEWLQEIDVVIIPSRSESFGMVIIEALSQGKLVIATRSGGPETILIDGVTGILIERKNPAKLAEAMLKVMQDPNSYNEIRKNGMQMVQELYSFDAGKNALSAILTQIFGNHHHQ